MKINAINNYRLNSTHFGNRNDKEIQRPVHSIPMSIKAIPFAVLLAMSPLNAPIVNAQQYKMLSNSERIVEKKKHMITTEFKDGTPCNIYDCKINYIRNKNNDPESERLQLVFSRIQGIDKHLEKNQVELSGYKIRTNTVNFKKLKKVNLEISGKQDHIDYENRYFVEGPGTKCITTTDLDGKITSRNYEESANIKVQISEALFNKLKTHINEDIEYVEELQLY